MTKSEFDMHVVLSITTGFVFKDRGMTEVVEILEYMTGETCGGDSWTVCYWRRCAEALKLQFPGLAFVDEPVECTGLDHIAEWLAKQEAIYGKTFLVSPLDNQPTLFV